MAKITRRDFVAGAASIGIAGMTGTTPPHSDAGSHAFLEQVFADMEKRFNPEGRHVTPLIQHLSINVPLGLGGDSEWYRDYLLKYNPGRKWSRREKRIIRMLAQNPTRKDIKIPSSFIPPRVA